ncbi:hypothetical protein SEA_VALENTINIPUFF_28 [Microbacterium phage ValentiniPuff]|uniref:DUF1643 domain-containing protein n=1 Tax=Microbacterium phage ValentiniPuff TaxID=2315705 RepID=A0A386KQ23_9CAUD|nr:hypothetical protein SEA_VALENTINIPUFF_28 [Microbacterium phage ValentiniPuff]
MADDVISDAVLSDDGRYRYLLTRQWAPPTAPQLTFVMLNPSTADASADDPTIRRCMAFARREGYGGIVVVNLFAYRATDPRRLLDVDDPIGPNNREILQSAIGLARHRVVAAWGVDGGTFGREQAIFVEHIATRHPLQELGRTKDGHPRHPLYVRGDAPLVDRTVGYA